MKFCSRLSLALLLALVCAPALAQVHPGTTPLSGAKGGTNNAFMQFAGPAASLKTFTLPNASGTVAVLNAISTWTAAQSFTDGTLILLGSGSGSSTLKAPATGGGTATLFAGSDTIAGLSTVQTWLGAQSFTDGKLILLGSGSGSSTLKAPATGGGAATLFAGSDTIAGLATVETWTGTQSFTDGKFVLLGSSSGSSTVKAPATGGGTATLFSGSDTIAGISATQTLTNKTFNCANQTSCVVRIGTDVSGLGTGVAAALAIAPNTGSGGGFPIYQASTWTPAYIGSSTAGTGQTYSAQVGTYEQIGRHVTVRFTLTATSLGTAAGNLQISGLPFSSAATTNDFGVCWVGFYTVSALAASNFGLLGFINPSSNIINLYSNGNTASNLLTVTQAGSSANIVGGCEYHT